MNSREGEAIDHAIRAGPEDVGDDADLGRQEALGASDAGVRQGQDLCQHFAIASVQESQGHAVEGQGLEELIDVGA